MGIFKFSKKKPSSAPSRTPSTPLHIRYIWLCCQCKNTTIDNYFMGRIGASFNSEYDLCTKRCRVKRQKLEGIEECGHVPYYCVDCQKTIVRNGKREPV